MTDKKNSDPEVMAKKGIEADWSFCTPDVMDELAKRARIVNAYANDVDADDLLQETVLYLSATPRAHTSMDGMYRVAWDKMRDMARLETEGSVELCPTTNCLEISMTKTERPGDYATDQVAMILCAKFNGWILDNDIQVDPTMPASPKADPSHSNNMWAWKIDIDRCWDKADLNGRERWILFEHYANGVSAEGIGIALATSKIAMEDEIAAALRTLTNCLNGNWKGWA